MMNNDNFMRLKMIGRGLFARDDMSVRAVLEFISLCTQHYNLSPEQVKELTQYILFGDDNN
jgi:hypothetical protein